MPDTVVTAQPPMGMITLRGALADLGPAILAETGCIMPAMRMMSTAGQVSVLWMSPDEVMILAHYDQAPALADRLTMALTGVHATVALVSDARQVFDLTGSGATKALRKLCPVDFANLAPDEVRRTRMAQIPAAFWRIGDGWRIVCFRSVARYAGDLLTNAAT